MQENITIRDVERPRMCVADAYESSPFVWRRRWKILSVVFEMNDLFRRSKDSDVVADSAHERRCRRWRKPPSRVTPWRLTASATRRSLEIALTIDVHGGSMGYYARIDCNFFYYRRAAADSSFFYLPPASDPDPDTEPTFIDKLSAHKVLKHTLNIP